MHEDGRRPGGIASARKEAKRWLHALQANADDARQRFIRALGTIPEGITLRDVQHALARERGFPGWIAMRDALEPDVAPPSPALEAYEVKAAALLDAYRTGTAEALERHYALTWHRRAWPAMRRYVQLDLGKRPAEDRDDVDITLDDARFLIAIEHGFTDWPELVASVADWPSGAYMTAAPVRVRTTVDDDEPPLIETRDWNAALRALREHPDAVLDAQGQATDGLVAGLAAIPQLTALRLGASTGLTDEGIAQLAQLPQLRHLDLSGTLLTDRGLAVLEHLPDLEMLAIDGTAVTDAGMRWLHHCPRLHRVSLLWTRTGDGAIRALDGHEHLTHLVTGSSVTDAGLAALHGIPSLTRWRGGDARFALLSAGAQPNQVTLRGSFTDAGMRALRGLDGLFGLEIADVAVPLTARAMEPLVALPRLGWLSVDPDDDWMPYIAAMPALRHLGAQDTVTGDTGWIALSASASLEEIWGRRCHNLFTRGFIALSRMPALRALSVSCLNVGDEGLAALPEFPALRELMPMDIPDAGYRHIGRCTELEALTLMYCRDTTDGATERITGLARLARYFNSYTAITDRTPQLLSTMESLERVTFVACHGLTDDGVASLARLPRLREVRASGNGLTRAVASRFPAGVVVRYAP